MCWRCAQFGWVEPATTARQEGRRSVSTERLLSGTPRLHQGVPLVGELLLTVNYIPTSKSPPHSPQTFLDNECDVQTCLHVCTSHVRVLHVERAHSRGRGDRWSCLHPPPPVLSNTPYRTPPAHSLNFTFIRMVKMAWDLQVVPKIMKTLQLRKHNPTYFHNYENKTHTIS